MIQEVGPSRRVENLATARGATEIDASGKVVMPGLIDAHTHLMFPAQPVNESDPFDLGRAARIVASTASLRLAARGRTYLWTMARHGTTTVEAKSGCGPNESAEMKVLRVLHNINDQPLEVVASSLFHLGPPGEDAGQADTAAAERVFRDLMFKIRRRRLARFAGLQWDGHAARRPLLLRFLDVALSLGFACKIHADQLNPGAAGRSRWKGA